VEATVFRTVPPTRTPGAIAIPSGKQARAGRNDAIEDKHQHDRQHGNAKGAERRATDTIRNANIATGHSTHDQPQQRADQGAGHNENCNDDDPGLWRRNFRIVREERKDLRGRRNCDPGPADIADDRCQAAQQAVMNPMTTATNRQR
jgi:hypothetical protein